MYLIIQSMNTYIQTLSDLVYQELGTLEPQYGPVQAWF